MGRLIDLLFHDMQDLQCLTAVGKEWFMWYTFKHCLWPGYITTKLCNFYDCLLCINNNEHIMGCLSLL